MKKYAYPIKIDEAIKDFIQIIDEKNMRAKFDQKIAENASELKDIRMQLKDAYRKPQEGCRVSNEFKEKINNLDLDESIIRDQKIEIERSLDRLTEKYIGITEVEKEEAETLITRFNSEVTGFQNAYSEELKRIIEKDLVEKGEAMLAEYKSYVDNILLDIEVGDFSFFKVKDFEKHNFKSVYELISKNVKKEDVYEEIEIVNYNRGWFEFWKPKTIKVQRSAGVKQTVNVAELVQKEIPEVSSIIKENVENIFREGQKETQSFKKSFNESIDALNGVVAKLLDEITAKVSNTEKLKQELASNKIKIQWISDIKAEIDDIMNF